MATWEQLDFDIIIAGGGTSGCVIAGRLAAADPSLRILILEAGPPTREDLAHVQPARYLTHLHPGSTTVKFNVGKESKDLGGRTPVVPCGQCLGGGSSVNFAMYTRPSASDYDDWETVHENAGWGSRDLIPLLQKMETYQVKGGQDTHGYSGPLKISYGGLFNELSQEFLDVAARHDTKRSFTDDPNGFFECNVYGRWQKYIDADNGRRSDVPHHYIYNRDHDNLEILTGYLVKRVVFENGRAVGVEYVPNIRFNPEVNQEPRVARAKHMVVISAGAFGSPAILERSGVGATELLQKHGIQTVVDLPGVGENYQDHNAIFAPYFVDEASETLDGIIQSDPAELERWNAQWLREGSGMMAHNGVDAGIKLRPSLEELETIGPVFQQRWNEYYANAPDKPVMWLGLLTLYVGDPATAPTRKCSSIGYFLDYPSAVGYVHITSADDVSAAPDFDPRFLTSPEDVAVLRWGYKHGRELIRRMPSYRGECISQHPEFPQGSQATCCSDSSVTAMSEPDIQYTAEDDLAIDDYIRKTVVTAWHSLGTCAMTARERGGVVDSCLNVYGVQGLKVADMSIAPANVSSNTYSTAVVIGEKAAAIIMEELGIIAC